MAAMSASMRASASVIVVVSSLRSCFTNREETVAVRPAEEPDAGEHQHDGDDATSLDPVSCLGDTDCDRRDRNDHRDNDPEEDFVVEEADFEVHSHHGRQQRARQQDH